jgi:xylulokinase
VIYDLDGNPLAAGSRPTEQFHPSVEHPEWSVWQPHQIWDGTVAAIREALSGLAGRGTVRALAVTGMGMDGLPVDEQGSALYPLISWHDPRTHPQHRWWLDHIGAEKVFAIGGNPLWPINSALRIQWLAEHEPEIYRRTDKWLLIEDYVNFRLCGQRVTDYSMASCTALFDQRSRQWSDELLELSGLDRRLLCELRASGTWLGEVLESASAATGLPAGTPVILGGHDHLCSALPVGAYRPGSALNVTGTWETVMTPTAAPALHDELRVAGMTVQAHVASGLYTIWGGNVSGEMLQFWVRMLTHGAAATDESGDGLAWDELMAAAAEAPAGSHGVMFLPHMAASACPVVDPRSLGALVGLSIRATRGDLVRSVLEGLSYQFLDMLSVIESVLDTRLEEIVAVGGATRNALWMQTKADVSGRSVHVPAVEQATPLGAAILAGIGVGVYRDEQEAFARVSKPCKTYQPNSKHFHRYADSFSTYRKLYPTIQPLSHGIFEGLMT